MKKAFSVFLCLVIVATLCGCTAKPIFSSEREEYLISAIGFDEDEKGFRIFLEAVIVNSEDPQTESKLQLIEGKGSGITEALQAVYKKISQPLMLSHTGVAVIGSGIKGERFEEICRFCYSDRELTFSIFMVAAENAQKLLSSEAVASVAVGYDIVGMLNQLTERTGVDYKNRLYEIESARLMPVNVVAIPYFVILNKGFSAEGLMIYKENSPALYLDSQQAAVYAIATNSQSKGRIFFDNKEYHIKKSYSKFTFPDDGQLFTELHIDLSAAQGEVKGLQEKAEELFRISKEEQVDILGIGNRVYIKNKKLWDKISKNYYEYYKNSRLAVTVK